MLVDAAGLAPKQMQRPFKAASVAGARASGRHAHTGARPQSASPSILAALATRIAETATSSNVELVSAGNKEGRRENEQRVHLRGGGEGGQPLNGRDEALEENRHWQATAFPSYMQSAKDEFCQNWDEALQDVERRQSHENGTLPNAVTPTNPVWQAMRKEAAKDAANEPLLSSFLYASILSHGTFLECLAFVLANRLSDPTMLATEYFETFLSVFHGNAEIVQAALDDIQAVRERDPACSAYSHALLFYKGYQAIQVHRIAHHLWTLDQKLSARNLQSRVAQVFAVDIHPQAKFGKGILMDHGTGIVIGQTAVVGNNVSILQNVTLGGTGKSDGDRHPRISDNVLIGAGATILGSISVGKGAMVASGSLVLKPVPPKTMVAGSPAKEVGSIECNPALKMQHWLKTIDTRSDPFCDSFEGLLQSRSQQAHEGGNGAAATDPAAATSLEVAGPNGQQALEQHAASTPRHGQPDQQEETPPVPASNGAFSSPAADERHSSSNGTQNSNVARARDGRTPADTVRSDLASERQQKGSADPRKSKASEASAVTGVRSDRAARKMWPSGPEPEYYL